MDTVSSSRVRCRQVSDLPCPKGLPFVGNLHQLSPTRLHLVLEQWAQELGSPFRFQICRMPVTVWTDPELCQAIMRERPHRYRRYASIEPVLEEIGTNGLFSAEGAAWAPQRKLIMQSLSIPNIKAFYPGLKATTERLYRRWQSAAAHGKVVEMTDDLKRYTVDVTSALAFGEDPRTLEQDRGVIQEHLALIFPMLMNRINAPFPYWRYVKLPRDRQLDRSLVEVHRYVRSMMSRARERIRDEPSESPRHLLEAMLAMRDTPGSGVTDDQVAANVLTLLLAGEDTTANSIAWALLYIAADPALQQRLFDSARGVLGSESVCPDFTSLKQLDLFEAVCTETGRLRPVAAVNSFEPLEDVCLADIMLPAGTKMFFLNRPATLDEKNFSNPLQFDPDRWLHDGSRPRTAHDPRAYLQFGAGPRVCPGRYLAAVEMRLVLSMLMANFSIQMAVDPGTIREVTAFTMVPSAMPVRLTARTA
ncbi:cytochrome P450 [Paraburkholderia sp. SIMBA_050]|uniref:Cytochrome P450 n=1 Tax=Paraburkholderia terricola TaxID=169427 RepID=A0A1M6Y7H0_9BURK|nr:MULTISPECIES: cytochrome P450 [Paraburkholderia]SDP34608.1 Cytochrome P450 [Paraburkholderia sediminicola]SHL14216.1 Cytochrome P450 [Paraburkholderia terricola]